MGRREFLRHLSQRFALAPRTALSYVGDTDGIAVGLEVTPRGGDVDFELTLTPAHVRPGLFAVARQLWFGEDRHLDRTGDAGFDADIAVRFASPLDLALFDTKGRELVSGALLTGAVVIDDGRVVVYFQGDGPDDLGSLCDRSIALVQHLGLARVMLVERLLAMEQDDPSATIRGLARAVVEADTELVRARAARVLARQDEARPPTIDQLLARATSSALKREDRAAALLAAIAQRPTRAQLEPHLPRLASLFGPLTATDRGAPFEAFVESLAPHLLAPEVDREAALALVNSMWPFRPTHRGGLANSLRAILAHLALPETLPLLADLADTRDAQQFTKTAQVMASIAGSREELAHALGPAGLARLVDHAQSQTASAPLIGLTYLQLEPSQVALGVVLLERLAKLGDPRQEDLVLRELESPVEDIRDAAIRALGGLGTERALPYLRPLTSGLFRSASTKALARAAIDRILERAGKRDLPGALSVASPTPGALSLEGGEDQPS